MTAAAGASIEVCGGDAQLAEAVAAHAGSAIRFVPDASSDFARAIGIGAGRTTSEQWTLDVLRLDDASVAVNMVVLGVPPDRRRIALRHPTCEVEIDGRPRFQGRAATVVVANGEYLRGLDVVPRGHPGDGRLEVHVHALSAGQRRKMRARLPTGTHVPHPGIRTLQGTSVLVRWARPVSLEVDGVDRGRVRELGVSLAPGVLTLLA